MNTLYDKTVSRKQAVRQDLLQIKEQLQQNNRYLDLENGRRNLQTTNNTVSKRF